MSKIGETIRQFRKEKGLKQSELAEMMGKSHNVISSWESGVNRPDVDSIEKLLSIFDIDANMLFGWVKKDSNEGMRSGFIRIHKGQSTHYDTLSPENKKIIDAHIEFLLSQQR